MINLKDKKARQREWAAQFRLQRIFEKALSARLSAEFQRVGKAAAATFLAHGAHAVDAATSEHNSRLTKILVPYYLAVGKAFSKRTNDAFKKAFGGAIEIKDTEDEVNNRLVDFARRTAAKKVTAISNTTKKRIAQAIINGTADQSTPDEIAQDIEDRTGGAIGDSRATLIARTETHSAAMDGSLETAKALNIPLTKEWLAIEDDRTRSDHSDVDGDEVSLDDTFDVGDDQLAYPGDPDGSAEEICNCRCALVYNDQ